MTTKTSTYIAIVHDHKGFSDILIPVWNDYRDPITEKIKVLSEDEAIEEAKRIKFTNESRWIKIEKIVKRTIAIQEKELGLK